MILSRLSPTLLVVLSSFIIIILLLSTHILTSAAFCTCSYYSHHRRTSPHHHRITLASDNDDTIVDPTIAINDGYNIISLQRRLHLTPDETKLIQNRIGGITPRKKKKKLQNCNNAIDDNVTAGKEQPTMERNLAYLEEHLGMTMEQLRRIVVGYPLVLKMKEANLMSAVEFFANALWYDVDGGDVDSSHTSISYDLQEDYKKRLAAFLCESPQLLEYNVEKRLKPRLERLRIAKENQAKEVGSAAAEAEGVDEEMLRSIATLTESRFETWLLQIINGTPKSDGDNNEAATQLVPPQPQRQPNNNPSAYVILSNLQSGGNIGNIVRSASIFGCEECIVVGQKRYRMTGDHGSRLDLPQRHMWSHADVKEYLDEKRVRIYGIEIMENASPIMQYDRETGVVKFPFEAECEGGWSGSAFIFGNEGQGLSTKQREICDEFLFIPQNRGGSGGSEDNFAGRDKVGSASMNVACAAAVVLQAYSMWAGYSEARFEGEKFLS
ncbi:SpoU family RNA methyltransferase [Skeletonema marinoi]|uniref:SpoU family RNA methyltransferase n=1 Tax=Skeletonema marinoi TaxID=267567 RepID=A0AAD8XS03_9STRA|nr:SpoU family RNA methyltransferase [Skeletonema marinoi]